jgi:predicted dehydrogenase
MPVRLGLLSTARINDAILTAAALSREVDVVAVGSRDAARADAYARKHGIARAHRSYDALLADPDVDAIYVSLPNALHAEWTLRCLAAGKHVLCEKPFSRHAQDVVEAFDAAHAAGLVLMEAFMYRHHPQTRKLRELVRGGSIGELRAIRSTFEVRLDDRDDVRFDPALDGGSLMDLGCYCVSVSRLLGGEPTSVVGMQRTGPTGVDVGFTGTLELAGGVQATFACAFDRPYSTRVDAIGSEGVATVSEPWSCREHAVELRRGACRAARVDVEDVDRYRLQLENFAAAARGDAEPLLGRDDALGQARTIEALYSSAEEGGAVSL